MRTEADLRAALAALEEHAPDADAVLARLQPHRHAVRRRAVLIAAAAAGVVAIPVTGRLLAGRDGSTAAPRSHPLRLNFTIEPFDGYELAAITVQPDQQQVRLQRGVPDVVFVTAYEPGGLDTAPIPTDDPVTVRGRRGYYAAEPVEGLPPGDPFTGVFWEYTPDAWANVSNLGMAGERELVLRVAADVRFGQSQPLRVPYRIRRLPAGWRPVSGGRDTAGPDLRDIRTSFVTVTTGSDTSVTVSTGPVEYRGESGSAASAPIGEPVVIGDPDGHVLVNFGSFRMTITRSDAGSVPLEQLLDLARSVTPTPDYRDLSAWFDATEVFPAG